MSLNNHDQSDEDEAYEEEIQEDEASKPARDSTKVDEGPACQACRRKKAKCSRRQPCSHCSRYNVECIYDEKRARPGMRTGAIENLNQRLASLENMFLGQGLLWQQVWKCLDSINPTAAPHTPGGLQPGGTLQECTAQLKRSLSALQSSAGSSDPRELPSNSSKKRRRLDGEKQRPLPNNLEVLPLRDDGDLELPDDLVDSLVEIYFARIQPWIPILHVRVFRQRMRIPSERPRLKTIFYAIVSLCSRFSDDPRLANHEVQSKLAKKCRQNVILESMESFSVENLQALVICSFDTIGSGRGPSAWSIVGSMARTAEHLQLSVEDEDPPQSLSGAQVLINRMAFLPPNQDWIEVEERRRVFWNVFLMDRFCSIATGWNLSLTSADVKRRLPCEGALWEAGEPLATPTPYFGVSDQSTQKNGTLPVSRPELEDQESLGGFAYCIEATESLSLVTSFFLQQSVDITKMRDVQLWLMRFKQLDLRLVQWKIFLPERWREACALNPDGNMDPNLTLAHITHNTAVVLLHQCIAYPSPDWQTSQIRLPSASSADTCLAAAREVSIIADKFLQGADFLTNPQFAFCLFICGRMLIAHSAYYGIPLSGEFDVLVDSLVEISRRWNGPRASVGAPGSGDNLASKFACRLSKARQLGPSTLDIRQPAYSENEDLMASLAAAGASKTEDGARFPNATLANQSNHLNSAIRAMEPINQPSGFLPVPTDQQDASPDSISLAFPPLPIAFQAPSQPQTALHSPTLHPLEPGQDHAAMQFEQEIGGYEMLNSFLDYTFQPDQRISMFSHPTVPPP